MFTNPFPNAFGLDIGDLSVKLVQLKNTSFFHRQASYKLIEQREINLPPGLIVNGELEKPEEVRKRIAKLLKGNSKQKSIKSPWVVTSLPETQSFIKHIKIKKPADDLIDEDIISSAKKHIPFEKNEYYFEWQILPNGNPDTTDILIGAVPKKIADSYTYLMESLGLGVLALEIEALSLARAMITAQKKYINEARAILHIGATRSSFIVHDHDTIQFSTILPYSGELVTTALAQKLHLSYEDAEKTKQKYGVSYQKRNSASWKSVVELNSKLIRSIDDAINFYYSHFENANKIKKIVMCGGGANMKKLDKIISAKTKISSRPGNPWKNLGGNFSTKIEREKTLPYAGTIGLALRAADNPFLTRDII